MASPQVVETSVANNSPSQHRRMGPGGGCSSPPQNLGNLDFLGSKRILAKPTFKEVCMCVCMLFFFEERYKSTYNHDILHLVIVENTCILTHSYCKTIFHYILHLLFHKYKTVPRPYFICSSLDRVLAYCTSFPFRSTGSQ